MKTEEINRVIVRGTNWVGDVMMLVPALRELRRVLPAAQITLSMKSWAIELFADFAAVDDFLVYEPDKTAFGSVLKEAKKWRAEQFDLAVLFQNAFAAAALARLARIRNRVGYQTDGRSFLLTHPLAVPKRRGERHEVFYYLNIIAELETLLCGETKVWEREPDASLAISETRKAAAREILVKNAADLSKKIVALCPGSTNSRAKRWQPESYAKLADLLKAESNREVVLIGSPDEIDIADEVMRHSRTKPVSLVGKTSLAESAAILSLSDLLVANDTGPAHIAPAVGTPTIVIFGPTTPATTRPFSDLAQIVRKPPACAPCMLRDCPIDHRCMTAITPEEILRLVESGEWKVES